MNDRFYITTAIDYANGPPHLGHILEKVGADAIARFRRLRGDQVRFVIGMDEHGQKVAQTAAENRVSPQEWVNGIADLFRATWARLHVAYDDFIRTSEPRHRVAVEEMIRRMQAAGDLYRDTYAGHYCIGCEAYKGDEELVEGRCPIHPGREVQWMEEEDWFFRLSRYGPQLARLLEERPDFVQPEARRNEVRRMVQEIKDISVSRSLLGWGIPWPGEPQHTVYVWIDALTNYLSAIGFPDATHEQWWPASLHVIGKDIVRFHCVYWPAMLISAELPVPERVWAHGFATVDGRKLSKSGGAWVDVDEAVDRYGPDALRYFLLREVPWNGDGDWSWARFDGRYTAELANDLGNLANRVVSMIHKYRDGEVPAGERTPLDAALERCLAAYGERMDAHLLHEGLAAVFSLIADANSYVGTAAPWTLARDPARTAELDAVLGSLARTLAVVAVVLTPFMPGKMADLWTMIGGPKEDQATLAALATLPVAGWRCGPVTPLFPRPIA